MIVAGFGFRQGVGVDSLNQVLTHAAQGQCVAAVATARDKASGAVFRAFAQAQNLPVIAIDSAALEAQQTVTQAEASKAARNAGSVAEAAALAAAGPGARLLSRRVISADRMATCALAHSATETKGDGI